MRSDSHISKLGYYRELNLFIATMRSFTSKMSSFLVFPDSLQKFFFNKVCFVFFHDSTCMVFHCFIGSNVGGFPIN